MGKDSEHYGEYEGYSLPRRMKLFVKRVSLVCRRWKAIALGKGNSHYWVTSLTLFLYCRSEERQELQHARRVNMVTQFRQALRTATDSDIEIYWFQECSHTSRDD